MYNGDMRCIQWATRDEYNRDNQCVQQGHGCVQWATQGTIMGTRGVYNGDMW